MEVRTGSTFRPLTSTTHVFVVNLGQPVSPKLKSLSFDDLKFSAEAVEKLLEVVGKMCDLDSLTMRWCRVPDTERLADIENLVQTVVLESVTEINAEYSYMVMGKQNLGRNPVCKLTILLEYDDETSTESDSD